MFGALDTFSCITIRRINDLLDFLFLAFLLIKLDLILTLWTHFKSESNFNSIQVYGLEHIMPERMV